MTPPICTSVETTSGTGCGGGGGLGGGGGFITVGHTPPLSHTNTTLTLASWFAPFVSSAGLLRRTVSLCPASVGATDPMCTPSLPLAHIRPMHLNCRLTVRAFETPYENPARLKASITTSPSQSTSAANFEEAVPLASVSVHAMSKPRGGCDSTSPLDPPVAAILMSDSARQIMPPFVAALPATVVIATPTSVGGGGGLGFGGGLGGGGLDGGGGLGGGGLGMFGGGLHAHANSPSCTSLLLAPQFPPNCLGGLGGLGGGFGGGGGEGLGGGGLGGGGLGGGGEHTQSWSRTWAEASFVVATHAKSSSSFVIVFSMNMSDGQVFVLWRVVRGI